MQPEAAVDARPRKVPPSGEKDSIASIAGQMAIVPTGVRAALRRLNPDRPGRAMGAVIPVLVRAGLEPAGMSDDALRRWAAVCHFIATLSGAGAGETHRPDRRTGRVIRTAGYSEHRLMRLMSARGPALADQVRRLARYLAAAGAAPLDLRPIAALAPYDGRDNDRAERARLEIARGYYAAMDAEASETEKGES